ncbi:MAG: sialate O-acetylesterase [Saprospiraceae bacterium]
MVLQRDRPIKIFGTSTENVKVNLEFRSQKYTTISDIEGHWEVILPPEMAGGPYKLIVESGEEEVLLYDILIGDIWFCAGQSNIVMTVNETTGADSVIEQSLNNNIRYFHTPNDYSYTPEQSTDYGKWEKTCPNNVGNFSAVSYLFAKHLEKSINVPIGVINSSWGGSRISNWMRSQTSLSNSYRTYSYSNRLDNESIKREKNRSQGIEGYHRGIDNCNPIWADLDLDESDWSEITTPVIDSLKGTGWYRKKIELEVDDIEKDCVLSLGRIVNPHSIWINGFLIKRNVKSSAPISEYLVPNKILRIGTNVIAVRIVSNKIMGGFVGKKKQFVFKPSRNEIALSPSWKYRFESYSELGHNLTPHNITSILYNKMVNPFVKTPIKGILWYQGESDTGTLENASKYAVKFQELINGWRMSWKDPDLPFLFVQLPNFGPSYKFPTESIWAKLRDSQSMALKLKNTAQIVSIDIGDKNNLHPKDKTTLAKRLVLAARGIAYNHDIVSLSPTYSKSSIVNNIVNIEFKNIGSGLSTDNKYGYINGFALAGKDKRYMWANAELQDNKVIVSCKAIADPVYIRYGWANNPGKLNIYNSAGLPASPFQATLSEENLYKSPSIIGARIEDDNVIITFDNVGVAWNVKNNHGYVFGFSIASKNGQFLPSRARVKGNSIIIDSDKISDPEFVRFDQADSNILNAYAVTLESFTINLIEPNH